LKRSILSHSGINSEQLDGIIKPKLTNMTCPKCETVNALENDYCSKKGCGYPLILIAYDEIKKNEKEKEMKLKEVWRALYEQGIIKRDV
jgi:hypothetical protein